MSKIADDSESIAKRLKEIEAEKLQAMIGQPEPIEWTMGDYAIARLAAEEDHGSDKGYEYGCVD